MSDVVRFGKVSSEKDNVSNLIYCCSENVSTESIWITLVRFEILIRFRLTGI